MLVVGLFEWELHFKYYTHFTDMSIHAANSIIFSTFIVIIKNTETDTSSV